MGYHHVGQAGLELLTSGDLPALASQSAGITGVSYPTCPAITIFWDHSMKLTAVWAQQLTPVIPALWEAVAGGSLEVRSSRAA